MKNLIMNMNQLVADLSVLYRKLQNFHWNIEGKEFFVLHAKLEEYYDGVNDQIDEVAEQILMLEGQPLGTMRDYLEIAKIKEAENVRVKADHVYSSLREDFSYIKESLLALKKDAERAGADEVGAMVDGMVAHYSKAIWMLRQSQD